MTIRTTTGNAAMIARAIKAGEDFTTSGALKGIANPQWIDSGRMSPQDTEVMKTARDRLGIAYIVYSYGTPIAYRTLIHDEWVIPDAKYSVTTSKHQGVVRYAVGIAS